MRKVNFEKNWDFPYIYSCRFGIFVQINYTYCKFPSIKFNHIPSDNKRAQWVIKII